MTSRDVALPVVLRGAMAGREKIALTPVEDPPVAASLDDDIAPQTVLQGNSEDVETAEEQGERLSVSSNRPAARRASSRKTRVLTRKTTAVVDVVLETQKGDGPCHCSASSHSLAACCTFPIPYRQTLTRAQHTVMVLHAAQFARHSLALTSMYVCMCMSCNSARLRRCGVWDRRGGLLQKP